MDHDYVFQNDFAGEAYVCMADIPGVDGEEVSGFEALSVVSLPLMQPKHKGLYCPIPLCPKSPSVRGFVVCFPFTYCLNPYNTMHFTQFRQLSLNIALRQRQNRVKCIVLYVLNLQVNG